MSLNRYERENIKDKIAGYMVPASSRPQETHEQQFERAKAELLKHLKRQIVQVEAFDYTDMKKTHSARRAGTTED